MSVTRRVLEWRRGTGRDGGRSGGPRSQRTSDRSVERRERDPRKAGSFNASYRREERPAIFGAFQQHAADQLNDIRAAGTDKLERVIVTSQGATVRVADGNPVLNLCANN